MIEDKFLPDGFKAMISDSLGTEIADVLLPALNTEPDTSIRLNLNKSPLLQLYDGMTEVPWCFSAFYLDKRPRFTSNPLLHAGVFYVQDASSTVYETIVRSLVGENPVKAADLCAAPGGKTTALLNALSDGSVMLANEYVSSRANILRENLCKYGYPGMVITNSDTSKLSAIRNYFDLVTIDAPCSGEGMMRKEEVARAQWSEGLVRQCASLQREIIDNAVEMLAPGGYLIYSTCTFNTTEDEENAAYIAEVHGLTPDDTGLAGKFGIRPQAKGNVPCLRFMPGFVRGEGLFVAVFRKDFDSMHNAESMLNAQCSMHSHGESIGKKAKDIRKNSKGILKPNSKIDPKILSTAKSWMSGEFEIIPHNDKLLALTPATADLLSRIPKEVRIMAAGVEVGEIKGKDLVPSHSLAMSIAFAQTFPEVELPEEDALRYLTREAITLPPDTPRGYVTVSYCGFPLGFVKNLGNRSNNLYPNEYRIHSLG